MPVDAAPESGPDAEPLTRRERQRRELIADAIAAARDHLAGGGAGSVSWRGIAREVGINPASLYTYFDSLDDLFTAVITDSFGRLAEAVSAVGDEVAGRPPAERLLACAAAYRDWAVEHPAEFNLIFTDRIPGYAAPPDGPTVEAQVGIFGPFLDALADLLDVDRDDPAALAERSEVIGLWATMHGLVLLEINHHIPFVEDPVRLFVDTLRRQLDAFTAP